MSGHGTWLIARYETFGKSTNIIGETTRGICRWLVCFLRIFCEDFAILPVLLVTRSCSQ